MTNADAVRAYTDAKEKVLDDMQAQYPIGLRLKTEAGAFKILRHVGRQLELQEEGKSVADSFFADVREIDGYVKNGSMMMIQ